MTDYSRYFSQAEQKYGLRPGTGSALMSLEDASGNPYARSPKGARGVLQLMPGTASDMGVSNPNDPAANIDGGLHYFSNILNNQAHGDYRTAAMGYNAGPNRSSFPQSSQGYADQFMARMAPPPNPTPQPSGGQPPMPPQMPPQSLGALMNQQAPVNLGAPPPVNTDAMGTQSLVPQGDSLGALAQGLPQMPAHHPSKFNIGNILGVLGDSLMAYGGKQPTFGPMLQQEQMMGKQQDFEREKFQQELAMRMYQMTHPEEMLKAEAFSTAPREVRQSMVDYENTLHPTVAGVQQPNGSVINQVIPRQLQPQVGEIQDGHRYLGGDPANPNSWQAVQ